MREYLGPLSEQGILGLILIIGIVFTFFIIRGNSTLIQIITKQKNYFNDHRFSCNLFAHGILNNYLDTDKASILVWGLMSLFICLSNVSLIKKIKT